jgi:outer membrane protein assembly factor BamB
MDPKNILVIGVKGCVSAFRRDTGEKLWTTRLKSTLSADFVSVIADDKRVYAHTGGELFCVDLFTGDGLWSDGLRGLGYSVASLALAGTPAATTASTYEKKKAQDAEASASATSTTQHS